MGFLGGSELSLGSIRGGGGGGGIGLVGVAGTGEDS